MALTYAEVSSSLTVDLRVGAMVAPARAGATN
jgi:hypothetical protein